jgi:predicted RNA binding protein YcfA (HicA-like mRNA interferase family)
MKVREVIRLIEDDGWRFARQRGSHRTYKYPNKPGSVTVAGKRGEDVATAILLSILRQAGMRGSKR